MTRLLFSRAVCSAINALIALAWLFSRNLIQLRSSPPFIDAARSIAASHYADVVALCLGYVGAISALIFGIIVAIKRRQFTRSPMFIVGTTCAGFALIVVLILMM
jgi:hypothetical protein